MRSLTQTSKRQEKQEKKVLALGVIRNEFYNKILANINKCLRNCEVLCMYVCVCVRVRVRLCRHEYVHVPVCMCMRTHVISHRGKHLNINDNVYFV